MNSSYQALNEEIESFKSTRENYKKQYWIRSKAMNTTQQKQVKKLFKKIDRLRNHLRLWLMHLISKKPSNSQNYVNLIERGRSEIKQSFQQLDNALHGSTPTAR